MPRLTTRSARPRRFPAPHLSRGPRFTVAMALGAVFTLGLAAAPRPVHAQGLGSFIKQRLQDKKNQMKDSLSGVVVDKAAGLIQCMVTNTDCIKKSLASGKNVKLVDAKGNPVPPGDSAKAVASAGGVPPALAASNAAAAAQAASAASPGAAQAASAASPAAAPTTAFGSGVFVNYDFVPGDSVLFAEDFSGDNPGDFPRRLDLKSGNFEVATWKGQTYLRTTSSGTVIVPLPAALPDRFTFEADYSGDNGWSMDAHFADPDSGDFTYAQFSPISGGLLGAGVSSSSSLPDAAVQPIAHVAVMVDGSYAKAYINGVRVANVPKANLGRGKVLVLDFTGSETSPAYITNIRVAAGGKPLYDAIVANGRVATHGILFTTGSDQIRPESKPTLDQIGKMLTAHPELKLTIEGYTDNVGAAATNQTLSEKRAASVRQYLITNYHVDASRLASKGFGATKPAASNDTPEGRQQNRRVELVKM
jgi:OmpA-OmpF porin, OOP family